MKRKLLAGIVVTALAAFVTPAAHAGPVVPTTNTFESRFSTLQFGTHTATGGCFYAATNAGLLTSGQYEGVLGDASITQNANIPMGGSVTCKIVVNGSVTVAGPVTFGDGTTSVQAGAQQIAFTASPFDAVALCEDVRWADGTHSGYVCQASTEVMVPAQVIVDSVGIVGGVVDPIVCPILASLAGGYPSVFPVVVIQPDGDVYLPIPGIVVYDCPPL
ncbi:MAG: hypothetical protein JO079_12590 [Frankiaceae bacterium]|nr:hypothetical protein [Frankiaceae bacterium]